MIYWFSIIYNWLIGCCLTLENVSLIWKRHHRRQRVAKLSHLRGAGKNDLWAGRDLYRATPAVSRGLGFCSLIRRTRPLLMDTRLVRQAREHTEDPLPRLFITSLLKRNGRVCYLTQSGSSEKHIPIETD